MPGYARKDIVREGVIGIYHTWSRCVQQAFLCGKDPVSGTDFDYRRDWIKSLLEYQASVFAVDVGNYSVLSNHQHLIVRTRPDIADQWTDDEVAWRWKLAWPSRVNGQWIRKPTDEEIEEILAHPERIPKLRTNLASLSWFMARWKEPIARMANAESDRKGHFYEQRFGSREIVDDAANLCCNIYVDLNQIKAGMAKSLEDSRCSAIQDRLQAWRKEEAQASVAAFRTSAADESCTLAEEQVEKLLADCFLAPIGDQYPPLSATIPTLPDSLVGTTTQEPEPDTADDDFESEETLASPPATECSSATESSPETSDPAVHGDAPGPGTDEKETAPGARSSNRVHRRRRKADRVPTHKIHERLKSRRRQRASDQVYLGLPRRQYLEIVRWTAKQWLAERDDPTQSRPPPDDVAQILRQWRIAPDHWCEAIEHFPSWFHRAVGHVDSLIAPIQRLKQRWMQGIRPCRQVFT